MNRHYIKELLVNPGESWKWAVMWGETIVCLTQKESWAEQIAEALDEAHPYKEVE